MNHDDPLQARRTDRNALISELGVEVSEGGHCRCCFHDDKSASATVGQGRHGAYRFQCYACGFAGDIFDVIARRTGRRLREVLRDARLNRLDSASPPPATSSTSSPKKGNPVSQSYTTRKEAIAALDRSRTKEGYRRVATYRYQDASGIAVAAVVRYEKDEGANKPFKTFRQVSKHADGRWHLDAQGVDLWPLLHLREVVAAVNERKPVVICEGEKAADAVCNAGFVGTTTAGGAGKASKSDLTNLAGATVVIFPDNDGAGCAHLADLVGKLAKLNPQPRIHLVKVDDLPKKADAADLDAEEIKKRIEAALADAPGVLPKAAGTHEADLVSLDAVKPEPVDWLWRGFLPLGKLVVLVGDPGKGKTTIALDTAARISRGLPFPFDSGGKRKPGGVVLISAEDGLTDTLIPRLHAAGADVRRIKAIKGSAVWKEDGQKAELGITLGNFRAIEDAITRTPDCQAVIIDPFAAFVGGADSYKDSEVRGLLMPLAQLAERRNVVILILAHLNKASGQKATYRVGGSIGLLAAARIGIAVAEDAEDKNIRYATVFKSNLGKTGWGFSYRIVEAESGATKVDWQARHDLLDADAILAPASDEDGPNSVLDARMRERLELSPEGVPFKSLLDVARDLGGYRDRAVRSSLKRLKAVHMRGGFQGSVLWGLPEPVQPKKPKRNKPSAE